MSSTTNVHLTFGFADSTQVNFIIESVPDEAVADVKDMILAVNANQDGAYDALYQTFLSNDGASFTSIVAGKAVTVEEEVIYNG